MSIMVDSGGKVTASPKTGRILGKAPSVTQKKTPSDIRESVTRGFNKTLGQTPSKNVLRQSVVPSVSPLNVPLTMPQGVSPSHRDENETLLSSQPAGLAASTGSKTTANTMISPKDIARGLPKEILEPIGIDVDRQAGLDVWEQQAAQRENRPVRVANMFGEEYDMSGSDAGWFDKQLNQVGNTPMNDTYLRDAVSNGLSEDDAYAILHRPDTINAEKEMRESRNISPELYSDLGKVVDDGTSYDYAHMTSDMMTGEQYLHYRDDLGMGGRSGVIDPKGQYSKRMEAIDYDFVPFMPDMPTYNTHVVGNAFAVPGRLSSAVSNLRENAPWVPDYTIGYGDGKKISGNEFDEASTPYMNMYEYYQKFDPKQFLTRPKDGKMTTMIREYSVPDVNGNETYHYGSIVGDINMNDDGSFKIKFSDGSDVDVSEDYIDSKMTDGETFELENERVPLSEARGSVPNDLDGLNDIESILAMASELGGSPLEYADVVYVPDMMMPDGTSIPYEDVRRLYSDQTAEDDEGSFDDDISYEFSSDPIFGMIGLSNKPRRLMSQEIFKQGDDGGLELAAPGDIMNNAIDWTLGSIPISLPGPVPWLVSASNAAKGLEGIEPSSYNPTTGYWESLIAGGYDDNGKMTYGVTDKSGDRNDELSEQTRWSNALGNLAVPLTENIAGNVGSDPLKKVLEKKFPSLKLPDNPTTRQVLGNAFLDMLGEGIEEDIGNIADEVTQYGSGAFTNPVLDENGNAKMDEMGHEIRDYGTPVSERLQNFLNPEDLLNSFAGGALVSTTMNMAPMPGWLPGRVYRARKADNLRRRLGIDQLIEPDENEDKINVNGDYASLFDDDVMMGDM